MILPPYKLDHSSLHPSPHISSPVHPLSSPLSLFLLPSSLSSLSSPVSSVRVRQKSLPRHLPMIHIPSPHSSSPDMDLPHYPHRHRLLLLVQYVHSRVPDRSPYRYPLPFLHPPDPHRRRERRALRRPVHMHHLPHPSLFHRTPHYLLIARLSPKQHLIHPREDPLATPYAFLKQRRRQKHRRYSQSLQLPPKLFHLQHFPLLHYHQPDPVQQRSPDLERAGVKRHVRDMPHHQPLPELHIVRLPHQPHHVPVRHHHPFRLPRRSRRVHHVRQSLSFHLHPQILIPLFPISLFPIFLFLLSPFLPHLHILYILYIL